MSIDVSMAVAADANRAGEVWLLSTMTAPIGQPSRNRVDTAWSRAAVRKAITTSRGVSHVAASRVTRAFSDRLCAVMTSPANSSLPPGKWKYTEPRGAPLSASTSENAVPTYPRVLYNRRPALIIFSRLSDLDDTETTVPPLGMRIGIGGYVVRAPTVSTLKSSLGSSAAS